jgi:hypothetical protein
MAADGLAEQVWWWRQSHEDIRQLSMTERGMSVAEAKNWNYLYAWASDAVIITRGDEVG